MNELRVFENEEFGKLKAYKPDSMGEGYVYAVEYGDFVKIGSSINPYMRLQTFIRDAENYNNTKIGRVVVTPSHSNYKNNERFLHNHYATKRKQGTELFSISLNEYVREIPSIVTFEHNSRFNEEALDGLMQVFKELLTPSWGNDFLNIIRTYPYILNNVDKASVENELRDVADINCDFENLIFEYGITCLSPIIMNCIEQKKLNEAGKWNE